MLVAIFNGRCWSRLLTGGGVLVAIFNGGCWSRLLTGGGGPWVGGPLADMGAQRQSPTSP